MTPSSMAHGGESAYSSYLERLRLTNSRVLLLDYDGTLAPFHVDPARAFPYPGVPELLSRIMVTGTRVVLISGRPAEQLLPLTGVSPQPEIWGCHGLERLMPDGAYQISTLTKVQQEGIDFATTALPPKFKARMEVKPGGVAVHWRGVSASEAQSLGEVARLRWRPLLKAHELRLLEFDGGVEICSAMQSKGRVVETILRETPSPSVIAYLGDDLTDEDAFRALKGKGLSALIRPLSRPSAADIWLRPPGELTAFLTRWVQGCGENK